LLLVILLDVKNERHILILTLKYKFYKENKIGLDNFEDNLI